MMLIRTLLFLLATNRIQAMLDCEPIGFCEMCTSIDVDEEFCDQTGRKRLHFCVDHDANTKKEMYFPCHRTNTEETLLFVLFFLSTLVVGLYGYYIIQTRKKLSMTAFESRKAGIH